MNASYVINDDWNVFGDGICASVTLPHIWNQNQPSQSGLRRYVKKLNLDKQAEKRYYLVFNAVCGLSQVIVNGKLLKEHRGSYARFAVEATDALTDGANQLEVTTDNTRFEDINPLTGDFTYWGGIPGNVALLVTEAVRFDPTCAEVEVLCADAEGRLHVRANHIGGNVEYVLSDAEGNPLLHQQGTAEWMAQVPNVRLWNGTEDPYLYQLTVRLLDGKRCVEEAVRLIGFRSVRMDGKEGFFLNSKHLKLHGVARHHDHGLTASAPTQAQIEEDFGLIQEIGANAVRLSHYQHPQAVYDLCDKLGLIVWAEIPMLSMPDNNPGIRENAKQQLTELITQNRHHPSICFWGVQNEIAMTCETQQTYDGVAALNALVKELDDTRISGAANLYSVKNKSQLNRLTDAVGYNIYFGWYYGELADYAKFLKKFHEDCPGGPLGITEYGADANIQYQTAAPVSQDYTEQFQCVIHENAYAAFRADPSLWGSFVWAMFDFHSSIRDTGGAVGENLKGLVTIDRKVKKDAFYFYKACWSKEPFVHICGSRFVNRCGGETTVKVYSNQPSVTLLVNGTQWETKAGCDIFVFDHIPMQDTVKITAISGACREEIQLHQVAQPDTSYDYPLKNDRPRARNWFEGEQTADPEKCYSIEDSIGDLLANAEAKAILEQHLPEIMANPRTAQGGGMALSRIFYWTKFNDEAAVRAVNSALNKISKM